MDGIHYKRPLYRDETPKAAIATLELLHDEPVSDVRHPRAAVAGEVRSVKTELRHLGDQVPGKLPFSAPFFDVRDDLLFDKLAHGLPHQFFFVIQKRIEFHKVHAAKWEHRESPFLEEFSLSLYQQNGGLPTGGGSRPMSLSPREGGGAGFPAWGRRFPRSPFDP